MLFVQTLGVSRPAVRSPSGWPAPKGYANGMAADGLFFRAAARISQAAALLAVFAQQRLVESDERHADPDRSDGTRRLAATHAAGAWTVAARWTSNGLKPYFNDFVLHNGHAYGFDGNTLACISLEDGSRKWKGGRYGNGQLVLLRDQGLLLVLSEEGELAVVKATPDQFTELARFPAIQAPPKDDVTMIVRGGEILMADAAGTFAPGDYVYLLAPPGRVYRLDWLFAPPDEALEVIVVIMAVYLTLLKPGDTVLGMNLADSDLDIEPLLKFVLKRPNSAHLRQCVSFDHIVGTTCGSGWFNVALFATDVSVRAQTSTTRYRRWF